MPASPLEHVLRHLRQAAGHPGAEPSDGELLERFIQHQDEDAFEGLVQRHGRMVLGVCRSYLSDSHAAEDAFQATFLVLVRMPVRSESTTRSPAGFTASPIGRHSRPALTAQRRRREELIAAMHHRTSFRPLDNSDRVVLTEELHQLPEKYRAPLLLCYLEGKTNEETARQLGWPLGTVSVRMMRGRDLLRQRLTRRGVTLSAAALPLALAETASAALPPGLTQATLQACAGRSSPLCCGRRCFRFRRGPHR